MRRLVADSYAPLFLLAMALLMATPFSADAGRIIVLEEDSDTLRTTSRESRRDRDRNSKGIEIRVERGDRSDDSHIRFETDWDTDESGDVVRFGESIVIREDQTVEGSVVAIGGDIRIDGTVDEDVVALGGTIRLGRTAVVEGDAVILGGRLIKEDGAEVYGEDVGMSFTPGGWLAGTEGWGGPLLRATILFSIFVFLLFSGVALQFVFPERMSTISAVLRRRVWASLFAGVALHILFGPVLALLTIIVIGIPIAILLPFVYLLVSIAGSVVVAAVIGSRILGADLDSRGGWFSSLALGLLLLVGSIAIGDALASSGFGLSPVGQVIVLLALGTNWTLATIGMGAAMLSRFGGRRPSRNEPPVPPEVPPLPPVDPLTGVQVSGPAGA